MHEGLWSLNINKEKDHIYKYKSVLDMNLRRKKYTFVRLLLIFKFEHMKSEYQTQTDCLYRERANTLTLCKTVKKKK